MWEQLSIGPDGDVKYEKIKWSMKKIVKSIAAVLAVLFFFPLCTVSCGEEVEISGLTSTIGVETFWGERTGGNILCILLFLLPVFVIGVFYLKKIEGLERKYVCAVTASILHFLALIVYGISLKLTADDYGYEARFTMWYYLSLLGSALLTVCTGAAAYKLGETGEGSEGTFYHLVNRILSKLNASISNKIPKIDVSPKICYKCGNIMKQNMNFCPKCGTPYKDPSAKK